MKNAAVIWFLVLLSACGSAIDLIGPPPDFSVPRGSTLVRVDSGLFVYVITGKTGYRTIAYMRSDGTCERHCMWNAEFICED